MFKPILFMALIVLNFSVPSGYADEIKYAISDKPTVVLNTPDFSSVFGGDDGKSLKTDKSGLVREVEFVALPGSVFTVLESITSENGTIFKVTTNEYPSNSSKEYYIDSRFVRVSRAKPPEREKFLPGKQTIINNLVSAEGSRYIWGGNNKKGIPEMLAYYTPKERLRSVLRRKWILKGTDCSGLLYEATNGFTPRNTSDLINYGEAVNISGLSSGKIISKLQPLDIIAWDGHVIIVIDDNSVIESRVKYDDMPGFNGVRIQPLRKVLSKITQTRKPVNNYKSTSGKRFTVRRWLCEEIGVRKKLGSGLEM